MRQLTDGQRDHLLIGIRLDDDVLHDRSYGIVRPPGNVGGAYVPSFAETRHGHLDTSHATNTL